MIFISEIKYAKISKVKLPHGLFLKANSYQFIEKSQLLTAYFSLISCALSCYTHLMCHSLFICNIFNCCSKYSLPCKPKPILSTGALAFEFPEFKAVNTCSCSGFSRITEDPSSIFELHRSTTGRESLHYYSPLPSYW